MVDLDNIEFAWCYVYLDGDDAIIYSSVSCDIFIKFWGNYKSHSFAALVLRPREVDNVPKVNYEAAQFLPVNFT